ncbi:contractile injection system tape measure protein [Enterobacter bugandensis]|uniref:contractile injection system tape measure protein n=1 Tax=Enterobacter bugandensis TaxID=881260 RepID=UPI002FD5D968
MMVLARNQVSDYCRYGYGKSEKSMVIERIKVVLRCRHRFATYYQHEVSHSLRTFAATERDTLFGKDSHHRVIDTLTLNLGTLDSVGFSQNFLTALKQALQAALEKYTVPTLMAGGVAPVAEQVIDDAEHLRSENALAFDALSSSPGLQASDNGATPTAVMPENTPPLTASKSSHTQEIRPDEALMRFFSCGYWPAGRTLEQPSPAAVLESALFAEAEPASGLPGRLAEALWNTPSRQRLWQNSTPKARLQLFRLLTRAEEEAAWPGVLAQSEATLMLAACHYWLFNFTDAPAIRASGAISGGQPKLQETEWPAYRQLYERAQHRPDIMNLLQRLAKPGELKARRGGKPLTELPTTAADNPALPQRLPKPGELKARGTGKPLTVLPTTAADNPALLHRLAKPGELKARRAGKPLTELPTTAEVTADYATLPERLAVSGTGIVLLWPLLPRLFAEWKLVEKDSRNGALRFISQQTQSAACALLDTLVWDEDEPEEWRMMVGKWLCGWPLALPFTGLERFTAEERASLREWLAANLMLLPGVQKMAMADIRALFLQREGVLEQSDSGWHLTVTPHPADALLAGIPWPLTSIMLPWLAAPPGVHWALPVMPSW